MSGQHHSPSSDGVPLGDAAQMEQIRQSLARVATDAAEKAAQSTVERLFVTLGVDITKPEGIIRLQSVLKFGGEMLDARETIRGTSLKTAVGIMVAGFLSIIVLGFKDWLTPH